MELDKTIREWILWVDVLIDIIKTNCTLSLTLIDNLLHLFVLLLERFYVTVYHGQTFFEIIDLII